VIDLGTGTAGSAPSVALTFDEAACAAATLEIDVLPAALALAPPVAAPEEAAARRRAGAESLAGRGLLDSGEVRPDIADAFAVLAHPEWELAARWSVRGAVSRLSLAVAQQNSVLALRAGETLVLNQGLADPVGAAASAFGQPPALEFDGFSVPTAVFTGALNQSATSSALTGRLIASGVPEDAAEAAGALAACDSFAEITAIRHEANENRPAGGPVALFDTPQGRVVATSARSEQGERWTTVAPGSYARLRWALDELASRVRG
jgi:hypothetical protein